MFNKKGNKMATYILIALLIISVCLNIYFLYKMNVQVWPPQNKIFPLM